jgi:hypothetical protein
MEQSVNGGSGGRHNNDATMCEPTTVIPWKTLNELKMSVIQHEAEKKYLQDRLGLEEERKRLRETNKDIESKLAVAAVQVQNAEGMVVFEKERADRMEAAAKEQVEWEKEKAAMAAAAAKERFEREKLQQATVFLQEKVALELKVKEMEAKAKDMELANLRMQLEREKTRNSAMGEGGRSSGGNISRKRAQESALETEDDEEEDEEEDGVVRGARAAKVKLPPTSIGTKLYWLVVYEGEVEVTFDNLHAKLPDLSKIESARFNERWYALLHVSRRIRSKPIMKAMHAMGIAGRVWVEAGHGCEQWVGFDIPECDVHAPSSSSEEIVRHMVKNQRAPAQFAMVVVKE